MNSRKHGLFHFGSSPLTIVGIIVGAEFRSPRRRVRRALAHRREGRLGPGPGDSRNDSHA